MPIKDIKSKATARTVPLPDWKSPLREVGRFISLRARGAHQVPHGRVALRERWARRDDEPPFAAEAFEGGDGPRVASIRLIPDIIERHDVSTLFRLVAMARTAMERHGLAEATYGPVARAYYELTEITAGSHHEPVSDGQLVLRWPKSRYLETFERAIRAFEEAGAEAEAQREAKPDWQSVPEFELGDASWISAKETATFEDVTTESLKNDRWRGSVKSKNDDGTCGIDRVGRMFRKPTKNARTVWYYKPSLRRSKVSEVAESGPPSQSRSDAGLAIGVAARPSVTRRAM